MLVRLATAAVAALIAMPGFAGAQVLDEKNVSVKLALAIAQEALACGGDHVSVAVVDRTGRLRVFLQGDGAAPHNIELARRKAYTAETFGRPSAEWAARTDPGAAATAAASGNGQDISGQRALTDVIPLQGGVPIKVGDVTIGGVGLSGAPKGGPQEEACGKAGVDKVADQLK